MWEIYYRMEPYPNLTNVGAAFQVVTNNLRPEKLNNVKVLSNSRIGTKFEVSENEYWQIMQYCWNNDPSLRPTFDKLSATFKEMIEIENEDEIELLETQGFAFVDQ